MTTAPRTFRLMRTETIEYVLDVTEADLLSRYGFTPDDVESADDVADALNSFGHPGADPLAEAAERHGDVQGSTWAVRTL